MKCPHCMVAFSPAWKTDEPLHSDKDQNGRDFTWRARHAICPECNKGSIYAARIYKYSQQTDTNILVFPRSGRMPLGPEVPEVHAENYREASWVLADSPKASAALSRRALQQLLRDVAKVKPSDLSKEIDAVLATNVLPSHLSGAIDAVRNLGNFAAHPIKSTNTGEIVDVEPGEAEWLLDVIEGLFDFYFVQPAILETKREALNEKLKAAGRPEMK
jgi:hypothetical protein